MKLYEEHYLVDLWFFKYMHASKILMQSWILSHTIKLLFPVTKSFYSDHINSQLWYNQISLRPTYIPWKIDWLATRAVDDTTVLWETILEYEHIGVYSRISPVTPGGDSSEKKATHL